MKLVSTKPTFLNIDVHNAEVGAERRIGKRSERTYCIPLSEEEAMKLGGHKAKVMFIARRDPLEKAMADGK